MGSSASTPAHHHHHASSSTTFSSVPHLLDTLKALGFDGVEASLPDLGKQALIHWTTRNYYDTHK